MYHRICLWVGVGSLLWCVAGQAQSPSVTGESHGLNMRPSNFHRLLDLPCEDDFASVAYRCQAEPHAELCVLREEDDLEPEPLAAAVREAEQEAAAKLRSFKNKAGRAKYLVITEQPDKRVTSINYMGAKIDDETLKLTARLCRIGTVNAGNSNITDTQLKYLSGLTSMNSLVLANTPITDKGLVHLRPLVNIQALHLSGTKVSDCGLDDIARLKSLKILNLSQTKVTGKGMKKLLPLTDLNWLLLSETAITDAGLAQLAGMKNLHRLTVNKTKVTPEGVAGLKRAIPRLAVDQ